MRRCNTCGNTFPAGTCPQHPTAHTTRITEWGPAPAGNGAQPAQPAQCQRGPLPPQAAMFQGRANASPSLNVRVGRDVLAGWVRQGIVTDMRGGGFGWRDGRDRFHAHGHRDGQDNFIVDGIVAGEHNARYRPRLNYDEAHDVLNNLMRQ